MKTYGWAIGCLMGLVIPILTSPRGSYAADWTQWRGPNRDGISVEAGFDWVLAAKNPVVAWKSNVGKGFSSPVIAGGRLYALGNREDVDTLYCLHAETGRELWRHSYASPLDPKSFEGGPLSTPTVDGERVYSLSKFGHCFCLSAESGKVLWSRQFANPTLTKDDYHVWWGFAGSIVVAEDRLLIPVGPAGLAVNKLTGETLWSNGPGHSGYSTPSVFNVHGTNLFAFVSGHEVVAAAVAHGEVLWRIPWKTTWDQNASDVLFSEGKLFVCSGHGVGCALFDIAGPEPKQLWRNQAMRTYFGSCVLANGYLYGFDDRQLKCLDWNSGEEKWASPILGLGTLLLADGHLLALAENGVLHVVAATPTAYQTIAQIQVLGGRCWSTPALAKGRLYLRNAAGNLVCLALPLR